jgi:CheY-like chemotaxis protein
MKLQKGSFEAVPLSTLPPAVLKNAVAMARANMSSTILVVDDDRKIADTIVRVLEANGYSAEAAYSGHQGVEYARTLRPGTIISDVGMPGMDGLSMIEAITTFLPQVRVVMICEQLPQTLAIPAWTVLKKPVSAIDLLAVLDPVLEIEA